MSRQNLQEGYRYGSTPNNNVGRKEFLEISIFTILSVSFGGSVWGLINWLSGLGQPNPALASDGKGHKKEANESETGVSVDKNENKLKSELVGNFPEAVSRWEDLIAKYAKKYRLPAEFIAAWIIKESSGDPNAISGSGAVGLLQVMPEEEIPGRPAKEKLFQPDFNLDYGTGMLNNYYLLYKKQKKSPGKALRHALGDYYGPGKAAVVKNGYADEVFSIWQNFSPKTFKKFMDKK